MDENAIKEEINKGKLAKEEFAKNAKKQEVIRDREKKQTQKDAIKKSQELRNTFFP